MKTNLKYVFCVLGLLFIFVSMSCSSDGGKKKKVKIAPSITSVAPTTACVNHAYSYTITATGSPTLTLSVSGIPAWLSFDGTNTISGIPFAGNLGLSETIIIRMKNGILPDATQSFNILVGWAIDASVGTNGSITPSGTVCAGNGSNKTFTITPSLGYHIEDVLVDSLSVSAVSSYSFTNVTTEHTIQATFDLTYYIVNGDITVNGMLPNIDGAILKLMNGTVEVGSCTVSSGAYSLSVPMGAYRYSIALLDYSLFITTPASGNVSVLADINQDLTVNTITLINYLKASNTGTNDWFGISGAIFGDTIVVGAMEEDSNATGINGNQSDNNAVDSGAVYVYIRTAGIWTQQAYLKASNTNALDGFGCSVAISGDTIVVGAYQESSNAIGINGIQSDNNASYSGAAYVFTRTAGVWIQQAYLKASNTDANDHFGVSVAISDDTIVVGTSGESSNATGVNGNQSDNSSNNSGAAYVFTRTAGVWTQQAYLKASNTDAGDIFGDSVAIDGDTIIVGAFCEASNTKGVNGNQSDNSATIAGAAYVFIRAAGVWIQQAYLKASNTDAGDGFGVSVAISGDTIVVGSEESSNATGVNGNQSNNSAPNAGAAYVFTRTAGVWSQQAYLKASNTDSDDNFDLVAIDGNTIIVGASQEYSSAKGINGDQFNNNAHLSGAAYVFTRTAGVWSQQAYLKASNTGDSDYFGSLVSISGETIIVGTGQEDSNATGVNGNQSDNSAFNSGAVYIFW